jgi:hypothetical protein
MLKKPAKGDLLDWCRLGGSLCAEHGYDTDWIKGTRPKGNRNDPICFSFISGVLVIRSIGSSTGLRNVIVHDARR